MTWDPILEGDLAEHARIVLADICDDLGDPVAPSHELALFWTYAAAALDDESDRPAVAMGRFAADIESRVPPGFGLHGGLAGVAWVAAHVADGLEPFLAAVDAALIGAPVAHFDLISGIAGLAVYFLERDDAAALAQIVDRLEASATTTPEGRAWFTPPALLSELHRATTPDGNFNCGLAHGVPGVIAVLAKIAARGAGASAARAAELRDDATRWLLAHRLPGGAFPGIAGDGPTRTAWCYGDPGIAVALWDCVPHGTRDAIALGWASRTETGVRDAALCHGSAGLAHIANRMFHATRDERYREIARTWFAHLLAQHRPGEGIGGFVMERANAPFTTASLVEGTIGVGLALLSAIAPIEPLWDRLFLCDLPIQ